MVPVLLTRTRRRWLGLTLACSLLASACGQPRPDSDRNLLIVTFDTLRADRLGCYGNDEWGASISPHADALADDGVLFERCLAPRGQTHPSLAAMLTGKYPITTGLRENSHSLAREHTTLFQILQKGGWQTGVFVANFTRGAPGDDWVYWGADTSGDGFHGKRRTESANQSAFQSVWDDRVEAAAMEWLDGLDDSRPFAGWVHFYDIHKPYNPPPGYIGRWGSPPADLPKYLKTPGPNSARGLERHLAEITIGERPVPAEEVRAILGLYDATVTATDDRLGRLLAKLEEKGLTESTYIVFTADHGEELFDHNRYFFHGASIYEGTVRIPLIVTGPEVSPGVRTESLVQNLDLAPTALELLGLPVPEDMEGHSLTDTLAGRDAASPRELAFVEWQDQIYSVSDGRWVYIHNPYHTWPRKPPYYQQGRDFFPDGPPGFQISCFEAYDLSNDPRQQNDLLADLDPAGVADGSALPEALRPLRAALLDWLRQPHHQREMQTSTAPEALEHVRQLGYVGGGQRRLDVHRAEPCVDG